VLAFVRKYAVGLALSCAYIVVCLWLGLGVTSSVPAEQVDYCQAYHAAKSSQSKRIPDFWETTWCDPISYFTFWITVFTGLLAGISIAQLRGLSHANQFNRVAHISSQRPWVIVTEIVPQLPVDMTNGLEISFAIVPENFGKSVANNVTFNARLHFPYWGKSLADEQASMLSETRKQRKGLLDKNLGSILVPGRKEIVAKVSATHLRKDIEANISGAQREALELQGLIVMIVCCVAYGFHDDKSQHYSLQTFRIERIVKPTMENPRGRMNLRFGEIVAANEIAFDPFPTGFYAD
jgi:hypothetical protein